MPALWTAWKDGKTVHDAVVAEKVEDALAEVRALGGTRCLLRCLHAGVGGRHVPNMTGIEYPGWSAIALLSSRRYCKYGLKEASAASKASCFSIVPLHRYSVPTCMQGSRDLAVYSPTT